MDCSKFNMYKTAGDIINLVMEIAIELCNKKMKASHICAYCDSIIIDKLNQSYKKLNKGIMLPTCLSINSVVSHNSYSEDNDYEFNDGDIVRIEMACHVNYNVASLGETIKIGDEKWKESKILNAAVKAMQVGVQIIKPGTEVIEFKNYIEKVVNKLGYYLVERPYLFQDEDCEISYDWCHRNNGFFCEPSWIVRNDKELFLYDEDELSDEEFDKEQIFTKGEAYNITVAISNNPKNTVESTKPNQIFQKTKNVYQLKSKYSRELLNYIINKYDNCCWKITNLEIPENRARLGLKECIDHGLIRSLGLVEQSNSEIVILKSTIIINNNSIYKLTGNKFKIMKPCDELDNKLNNILKLPKQFDKREDYLDF